MALYEFRCNECKSEFSDFVMYEDISKVKCECGGSTTKLLASLLQVDNTLGYYDHSLGQYIGSSSDKRRILKQLGKEEVGSRRDAESHNRRITETKRKENKVKTEKLIVESVKRANAVVGR